MKRSSFQIPVLLIFLMLFVGAMELNAQLNRAEAIGAYLYNFANLTSTQRQEESSFYNVVLVTENEEVQNEVQKIAREVTIKGKEIRVFYSPGGQFVEDATNLIFIGEDKTKYYSDIFHATQQTDILLVSENYELDNEILLNIYDEADNKLLFEINKGNIYSRRISINDEILMMGGSEIDLVELYLKSQKKLHASDSLLQVITNVMKKLGQEVAQKREEISILEEVVGRQKEERQRLLDEIEDFSDQIKLQKKEYNSTLDNLALTNDSLASSQEELQLSLIERQKHKEEIDIQNQRLDQLNEAITGKENILKEKNIIIQRQRTLVIISVGASMLILTLLFLLLKSLKKIRNKNSLLRSQKDEIYDKSVELTQLNAQFQEQNEELKATLEEIRKIQDQLVQSEKMASLGVLSAGIAHEINNPINFVYAGINSLLKDFEDIEPIIREINTIQPETDDLKSKIKKIQELKEEYYFDEAFEAIPDIIKDIKLGADRTAQIVKGLKTFSRMDKDIYELFDIHDAIDTSLLLLKNKYKNHIEIIKDYGSEIPELFCYPGKISQAFMNILSNAIDSIEKEGKIWISTSKDESIIHICIKDNGCGIPEDIIEKLYDPFFTTKDVGKGTGLGLSITYGIIQDHKGSINVDSEVNKGTEFIISLPFNK